MNQENNILIRRQLLDWRDKHVENIDRHLKKEMVFLLNELDREIAKIKLPAIFKNNAYTKKHLQPIYSRWLDHEASVLINAAQSELNEIYQHSIDFQQSTDRIKHNKDTGSVIDAVSAVVSTGTAIAAVPAITSTVSVGGILGLLGVTTTVVSWPMLIVAGGLLAFGGNKVTNLKSDAIYRYKKQIHHFIKERVISNKANDSVCQRLQAHIEQVASTLINETNK